MVLEVAEAVGGSAVLAKSYTGRRRRSRWLLCRWLSAGSLIGILEFTAMRIEKQKRQRSGVPRCRMYLRNELGWLPGFPLGQGDGHVSWMPAPRLGVETAAPLELEEEHVRRAAGAWTTLIRDFPRALPRVVDGLDRWKEGVPRILDWLTEAVHRGELLPPLAVDGATPSKAVARAERIAARRPALRALLSAASWSAFLAPRELPGRLAWIEANAGAVERVLAALPGAAGVVDVLTLSALANEDAPSVSHLLRIVGAARGPRAVEGIEVMKFAAWIGGQAPPARRRALRLLGLVLHDELLDELPIRGDRGLNRVLGRFKRAVAAENVDFYRQMLRLLERLPQANDAGFRSRFLRQWCARRSYRGVVPLLREIRRYLSSRPDTTLIDPWLNEDENEDKWGWLEELQSIDEERGLAWESESAIRERNRTVLDALARSRAVSCRPPVAYADGMLIAQLAVATGDAGYACKGFVELDEAGLRDQYIDNDLLRLAHELDAQAGRFATVVSVLRKEPEPRLSLLRGMERCLSRAGWAGTTGILIGDRQLALLRSCTSRWAVAEKLGVSVDPAPRRAAALPIWAQRYPETLRPSLRELAGVTGDAERIARGVLGKDFPDPADVQREIAALETQVAARLDARRVERLRILRKRLRAPRPVSPARLCRLRDMLEARTRRSLLASWRRRLDAELLPRFSRLLSLDEVPPWMFEPRQLFLLESILGLSAEFRSLGVRLLRARASSGPWNLIDDPANRAYLARVQSRNVNVEPWLHPRARTAVGGNGRTVELTFERDPLEVFQMGSHFRTCVSVGDCNFYSVLAVAADINKHVVYARDARGMVLARCLLALDDDGRILSFHPYCHDRQLGFDKMMGALATELADEMKTRVVNRGTVPCPVAPRWHDDGPVDVCGRFPFLDQGSKFRKSLPELADRDELVALLEKEFAPMPLNGYALGLVLELSEFDKRPDLIRSLLPLLDTCEDLDDWAWMRAARVADAAGASDFVRRVLRSRGVRHVLRTRCGSQLDEGVMLMLMEHDPRATIRLVRATRDRGVRSDEEDEQQRRLYLARAYELLGRPARARRMRAAEAQCRLGDSHRCGYDPVRQDAGTAFQWYRRAAEQGNATGQMWVGVMYNDGFGVSQDCVEGARWMRLAAEQGRSMAQFLYGSDCEDGRGVPRDHAQAAVWYRRAAEQGEVDARFALAKMYAEGRGVEQDQDEAVRWYRLAGGLSNAEKQRKLGDRFATGHGVPADLGEAAQWYLRAADKGDADAQCKLGDLLATGRGVPRDDAAAVRRYRQAAERAHNGARFNLGRMYAAGRGVPRDVTEAARWYREAAEREDGAIGDAAILSLRDAAARGEVEAQFHLGELYASRRPPNEALAYRWLSLAAAGARGEDRERMVKARDAVAARMKDGRR